MISSTPTLEQFKPLSGQWNILKQLSELDYSLGTHELLLSGSVGSAKSLTLAHIATTHCLKNQNANFMIGRQALPDLKATLCQKILEHSTGLSFLDRYNSSTGCFRFTNGSRITALSWGDKNFEKLGSYEFSAGAIEELVETKGPDAYDKILQRVGRLPHIKESFVISATNPSSPSHWAYKKLIDSKSERVHVHYSNTYDNPYLPVSYIEGLKERLDAKQVQRMIYGKWVEINEEVVYYEYEKSQNYIEEDYTINKSLPIRLMFDFNIGQGKPLSVVLGQYEDRSDTWHLFDEVIVEGQRTADSLEEVLGRGYFDNYSNFIIHGDATGRSRDTRNVRSDYDIIDHFLSNLDRKINFKIDVPRSNPPIRTRHNTVNGYLCNSKGRRKLFVYKKCEIVDEGLRLTALKEKGKFIEDDSKSYQHCTTSIGYAICSVASRVTRGQEGFGGVIGG